MGILDDAIREHLELKRRHGVAEEELQRQEEEALGPARRDVAQQHEETELAPGQPATAEADEEPAPAASSEDTVLFDSEADGAEAPQAAEPVDLGETQPHGFEAIEDEDDEAEPYDRDPDDEDMPAADDEDVPEDEDVSAGDDVEEDLLEDTPDFLQETPEHDRLWFEQKPPRDFDFD